MKPEVVRKKVVSKRVTPKGAAQGVSTAGGGAKKGSTAARTHSVAAEHGEEEDRYSKRYTPPTAKYAPGPSPWWVPAIMFGLLIVGALVIMLNYMSVFGEPANIRLVVGLAFILGGIITATQYR
ncbi:MAG: cell division protein CrgA [Actinobacteria bacterium]|nr:cell division protein CrgA [Actinomycetota bacterium]